METRRQASLTMLATAIAVAALLTGCTDTSGNEPIEVSESASASAVGDGACLEGEWTIEADALVDYYSAVLLGEMNAEPPIADGSIRVRFSDGVLSYSPDFTLETDVSGIHAVSVVGGELTGRYTVEDETLTMSDEQSDLTIDLTVNGAAMDASGLAEQAIAANPFSTAGLDCSGENPVITTDAGENSPAVRIELQPAE